MQKDSVGFPVFNSQDIFDIIYQGNSDKIADPPIAAMTSDT